MEKFENKLKRVNMNLPITLIERVKEYAERLGLNTTSAYIVLLNQALNQDASLNYMPQVAAMYNEIKPLMTEENIKKFSGKDINNK